MNSLLENIASNYSLSEVVELTNLLLEIRYKKESELGKVPSLFIFREKYESYISENHAPKYLKSVKLSFEHLSKYFNSETLLNDITPLRAEQFKSHLMKNAPKGYAVYLRTIRAAFSIAVRWGLTEKNPFKGIRIIKKQDSKKLFLTKADLDLVLTNTENKYFGKIFIFAFYTGMRVGEIVNLRWRNIDQDKLIITVGDNEFRTKTGRIRQIPFADEIIPIIKELFGSGKREDEFVFQKQGGYKYSEEHISRKFKDARRKSGFQEGITFHSLRHSFGSNLAIANVPITTIKELLGHTSIITTQIYSHANLDSMRNAISKLSL